MAPKSLPQTGFYPIKGIQAGLDPKTTNLLRKVPQRMEFDTWFTSPELVHVNQRALFFPAFRNFCQAKPDDKFSFFQIAGIHGKPYTPWDEDASRKGGNYCTHGVTTFTTWHRPYLLLFEQVIYEYMKDYATANFKGKDLEDMLKAADQWRLPYWDWAAKKADPADKKGRWDYNIPLVFQDKQKKVEIRLPQPQGSGKVDNALYQFTMPGGLAMGDEKLPPALRITSSQGKDAQNKVFTTPYHLTKGTSRHPAEVGITQGWVNGIQNNDKLVATLRNVSFGVPPGVRAGSVTESLRDAYFRLFTIENFEDFASTRPSSSGVYHNCESLHNGMHGWCGGPAHGHAQDAGRNAQQGHMSVVAVAAFDPLFWFHHCNIDRTIAIWQALHPTSWFSPAHRAEESDPLRPFHKDTSGTYWTSLDARETVPLGYTYPLLDRTAHLTPSGTYDTPAHQRAIITSLTDTYNAARSAAEKAALTADSPTSPGLRLTSLSALLAATPDPAPPMDRIVPDYAVNVLYEKMALAGRQFTVHVFVGRVPSRTPFDFNDPEGSLVGEVFNFTSPAPVPTDAHASVDAGAAAGCANCARQAAEHARATGRVVLTNALITRWKQRLVHTPREGMDGPKVLEGMQPEVVVPFLRANLRWRVTTADDGRVVEDLEGTVPSVKVAVVVGKAQHFADGGKLSRFWDYRPAYDVTKGQPGGVDESDGLYPAGGEWRPGV